MVVYATIIMTIIVLNILAKGEGFTALFLLLPIFGRIFGWW